MKTNLLTLPTLQPKIFFHFLSRFDYLGCCLRRIVRQAIDDDTFDKNAGVHAWLPPPRSYNLYSHRVIDDSLTDACNPTLGVVTRPYRRLIFKEWGANLLTDPVTHLMGDIMAIAFKDFHGKFLQN
ncbi:MAG: hypothetical protein WCD45_11110, partial [Gallionella sp.]